MPNLIDYDLPGEIWDLDVTELFEDEDNDDRTFEAFLNSTWDF